MYRLMGMACIVCLAATTPGRADDAAEARAIVEKAIKALGGADVLARHNAVVWKGAGSVTRDGEKHRVTSTWSVQGLDRYRWDAEADDGSGQKLLMVLNGDKGWLKAGTGATSDFPKDVLATIRDVLVAVRLMDLPTHLKDSGYTLRPLGELKINDQVAVGIKASHKGRPDLDLFFDKKTSLPVRGEVRLKVPSSTDEVAVAIYFTDYKEFGGRKFATRVTLRADDKEFLETERTDFKLHEKLDDADFAKP